MFNLIYKGATIAEAVGPFMFDPAARLWVSGDVRLYDQDLAVEQVAVDEPEGMDFQRNSLPPPPPAPDLLVTRLAFRKRFTQAEKIAIEMASLDDPAATMDRRTQSAALRVDLRDTDSATFIDLARQDTREGVLALELFGLLGQGRAFEILDAEIQTEERP